MERNSIFASVFKVKTHRFAARTREYIKPIELENKHVNLHREHKLLFHAFFFLASVPVLRTVHSNAIDLHSNSNHKYLS